MVFLHFRKFLFFAVVFLSFFLLGVNSLYSGFLNMQISKRDSRA